MIHGGNPIRTWKLLLPPFFLGASLFGLYLLTIAPGLTWANHGSDGGDLIAAAASGGIPHPTGYPLYLLLARLFQFLPIGSLAFRTNLMSAVFTALAAVLMYGTVVRHLSSTSAHLAILAGLTAGFCFGLAPLVWSQAVITEVYALQAFLMAGILYLYGIDTPPASLEQKRVDCWRGLALGLAGANHITSLLLVPLALILGSIDSAGNDTAPVSDWRGLFQRYQFDGNALGRQVLWLLVGLSLYLLLPVRALARPAINWGNPLTFERFFWLVSGRLYQGVFLQLHNFHLWGELHGWVNFIVTQLGWISIGIAILGLILFGKFSRLLLLTLAVASVSLVVKTVYRTADSDVYLIPLLISVSIWLGIGIGRLAGIVSIRSHTAGLGAGLLCLGLILVRPVSYFEKVDASHDRRAEAFGKEVLSSAPQNAILFAEGDEAVFALWYFHFARHERPDLAIVARDLLPYDWYRDNLGAVYPSLTLPGEFLWPETIARANSLRPTCDVQYAEKVEMDCVPPVAGRR